MEPVTIAVRLDVLNDIHKYVREAANPKVTYCDDINKMRKEADEVVRINLSLLMALTSEWKP